MIFSIILSNLLLIVVCMFIVKTIIINNKLDNDIKNDEIKILNAKIQYYEQQYVIKMKEQEQKILSYFDLLTVHHQISLYYPATNVIQLKKY